MATLKERPDNWAAGGIYLRDFRADKGTGYEETPHRRSYKKVRPAKVPGCKGNDNGPHIYVWVGARVVPNEYGFYNDPIMPKSAYRKHPSYRREWFGWTPFDTQEEHIAFLEAREVQICAGCYKKSGKKRMKNDHTPAHPWWF